MAKTKIAQFYFSSGSRRLHASIESEKYRTLPPEIARIMTHHRAFDVWTTSGIFFFPALYGTKSGSWGIKRGSMEI